ncbi:MAG: EAL domain-containing protein [Aestuariivirga sp.]|uniref:putative bifunctional diguanylate cyclase/phosphodiesterase n=1 Tax=Aestuariivirga sp. TaxID=2650926 RepID=UPI0025C49E7E|nr:EAL domain-containing protein [Aestuariivirga sp.]MCA3560799.1 EAL domain-containing protein [Aestuariivirga sp.]
MRWGGYRSGGFPSVNLLFVVLLLAAALGLARPSLAVDIIDISRPLPQQDITGFLAGLQTPEREIAIQRPDGGEGAALQMTLTAKAPGPVFNWVAAAFRNTSKDPVSVVLAVPHQGFTGSGFYPPRLVGPRVYGTALAGSGQFGNLPPVPGESAYLLSLPAGGTVSVAFEVTGGVLPVTMWQRAAFDAHKDFISFFRGALLGISVLIALAMFLLYGFRARALFPVAGAFALASIGFMLLEAGHLTVLTAQSGMTGFTLQVLRAVFEGLMAGFLLLLLAMLADLGRLSRIAANLLLIAACLAFAIPIYGIAEPILAVALARLVFALTALGGFFLVVYLWRRGEVKAETAVLSWTAVLLWTMLAVLAALFSDPGSSIAGVVAVGLAALLVMLGFVLAHHAFAQGYLSRHFFREAGRHALALAGARAFVWDWQPEEGELFLSPEIARALTQPANAFEDAAGEAFLELMHPADRSAYLATIAEAEADGRNPIERKFRLRHGDGSYRWFELRARSITGGNGYRAARCIGTITDVTNAKIAEERLLKDAVYDMVTGLPNRALFADRLQRAIDGLEPGAATGLFVLLVDLDRFKIVNDAMGHEAGDALLSIIGRRLKAEADMVDTVARLPGDQFAILYHEAPGGRGVDAFAQALLDTVGRPVKFEDQEYFLTASVGVAQYRPKAQDAERLMKEAAVALYEARRKGTGKVELFNPAMVDDRAELMVLEAELRRAIERNEIEVHYQPIARLADMHLAGFEALVRWRHPAMGLLAPESFLSLAEETGMIRDIGRVVVNEAGRQLGIWQRAYRSAEPAFIAVNISSAQLIEPSLLDDIKQIIGREGLLRGSFKIEVTESLVMEYPERAAQILERFRELGVGLSCDDFGTGYSSLSSLRKLPFDTLKVDRSFISQEAQDQRAVVILQSIIAMGHELGLAIVAEGIENQDQVDRLGELGCDYGQGFFIGKPMSAKQVNDALAGLPYAHTSGRTAITWLWERAIKDPPPKPALRRVTAEDVQRPEPEKRPARPYPRRRMEPDPVPKEETVPAKAEAALPPSGAVSGAESIVVAETIVVAEAIELAPAAEATEEAAAAVADEPPAAEPQPAAAIPEVSPPPMRRRRKRQRQVALPGAGEA